MNQLPGLVGCAISFTVLGLGNSLAVNVQLTRSECATGHLTDNVELNFSRADLPAAISNFVGARII